jgi:hypothetical protein
LISPWIDGKKAIDAETPVIKKSVSVEEHEKEWSEIFDGIKTCCGCLRFQDGHIDYDELDAFFSVNKKMADKYGMQVLDQRRDVRPRHADPFLPDQVRQASSEARSGCTSALR